MEHVQPSRCTEEFRLRKAKNDQLKAEAKSRGEVISTKRQPLGPKPGFMVEGATIETVTPIPYDVVNDLKGGYKVAWSIYLLYQFYICITLVGTILLAPSSSLDLFCVFLLKDFPF